MGIRVLARHPVAAFLAWRRRRRATVVIVSLSRDGCLQARALWRFRAYVSRQAWLRGKWRAEGSRRLARCHEEREGRRCSFRSGFSPRGPRAARQGRSVVVEARAAGGVDRAHGGRRAPRGSCCDIGSWDRFAASVALLAA